MSLEDRVKRREGGKDLQRRLDAGKKPRNYKFSGFEASIGNEAKASMSAAGSHSNKFPICYPNVGSLLSKWSELGVQIDSTKSDIIAVTETWLTQPIDL